jgi:uncharacterized protein (DUF1697 family)
MAVVISLLRGINVGGHHRIKMEPLGKLYASLGLEAPQTYLQSGNVLFRTSETDLGSLATRIEDALDRRFGFRPDVILRTSSELRDVVARNPFARRRDIDPRKLLVTFLDGDPGEDARRKLLAVKTDTEELRVGHRELYIYYLQGMARPKLSPALIEKTLQTRGTGRNWNTVQKLLELAQSLAGSRF